MCAMPFIKSSDAPVYACARVCLGCAHVCIVDSCVCMSFCICMCGGHMCECARVGMSVYMCACVYLCVSLCTCGGYMCVCGCMCDGGCVCICVHVFVYVCACVYPCVHVSTCVPVTISKEKGKRTHVKLLTLVSSRGKKEIVSFSLIICSLLN